MTGGSDGNTPLPECVVAYIESMVQSLGLRRRVCAEVRRELEHHFEDALSRVEGEPERAGRAEELIAEFGDEALLATLIRRGKIRCQKEIAMNISGVLGLALFVLVMVSMALNIGSPLLFLNVPALIICVGLSTALGSMSFGIPDTTRGIWALRALLVRVPPETVSQREVAVLRGLIGPVYASGLIGLIVGVIGMLARLEDPSMIGHGMAVALTCPFYAVLIAEVVLRPAVRLTEHGRHGHEDKPSVSQERQPQTEVESA
jgi:hypothetical protein